MGVQEVHQLLHGYSNGHRKLAGSLKLSNSDDELVNRISDLSGPLLGSADFQPYFTGYPLPGGRYYAVARTWIDSNASRAGSVLTHTLLIPIEEISEIEDFKIIYELLKEKPVRDELWRYEEPLMLRQQSFPKPKAVDLDWMVATDFVDKYFGEGLRPILWLDNSSPEDVIRCLVRELWPQMRQHFAFCTLSLQLRNLKDRPFDVLFAPFHRLSKHHQLERTNIVGTRSLRTTVELQAHEWQRRAAKAIFFDQLEMSKPRHEFAELWEFLKPDPAVIPRLYRLQELSERMRRSPMAAAGVMDLLSSLTPGQDQALSCKAKMVLEGIKSSESLSDPDQSLKSLYLISDRLRQTAFSSLGDTIFWRVRDAVSAATRKAPGVAIETGGQAMLSEEAEKSPYVAGVARGLADVAKSKPDCLLRLTPPVVSIPALVALEPAIAVSYFDATRGSATAEEVSRELVKGLRYIEDKKNRRRLRDALLPRAAMYKEVTLLKELLSDLSAEDVVVSLNCLREATDGFSVDVVRQVVVGEIVESHSDAVKKWGLGTESWTFGIASVVAASFTPGPQGLDEILAYNALGSRQPLLLAAFIGSLSEYKIPDWLHSRVSSDPVLLLRLLVDEIRDVPEACAVVERVLEDIPNIPLRVDDSLFDTVNHFQEAPFGRLLVDTAMGQVVREYTDGSVTEQGYGRWVDSAFGRAWFGEVPYQRLVPLIVQQEKAIASRWLRAWSALRLAPDTVYVRRHPIIDSLINRLWSICPDEWPERVTHEWVSIIQRAERAGAKVLHLGLCAQALGHCFEHPELPLSKAVVESFPVVYRYTLAKGSSTSLLGSLFYLFSDWDKGKELRQQIVRTFFQSEWPPEDLALAMPDQQTLRKIFKRLRRYSNGDRFIARMLAGLESCESTKAARMYQVLKEMVESPDFDEPWI